jgi:hypothetical protein
VWNLDIFQHKAYGEFAEYMEATVGLIGDKEQLNRLTMLILAQPYRIQPHPLTFPTCATRLA